MALSGLGEGGSGLKLGKEIEACSSLFKMTWFGEGRG